MNPDFVLLACAMGVITVVVQIVNDRRLERARFEADVRLLEARAQRDNARGDLATYALRAAEDTKHWMGLVSKRDHQIDDLRRKVTSLLPTETYVNPHAPKGPVLYARDECGAIVKTNTPLKIQPWGPGLPGISNVVPEMVIDDDDDPPTTDTHLAVR
jgi:hypothetical protein